MNLKLKQYIIGIIILIPIILTGCSHSSSVQSTPDPGMITGKVSITNTSTNLPTGIYRQNVKINNEEISASPDLNTIPVQAAVVSPTEYIIKFNKNMTSNYINRTILNNKGQVLQKIEENTFKIEINNPEKNSQLLSSLHNNSAIKSIEPNYLMHIQSIPTDPRYPEQWNLKMLKLENTWDKFKGNDNITVAVLDTGIIPDHPDLRNNIIPGYDFVDNDNDPTDTSPNFSHGTHVAGIIGALTDNQEGIAGINWHVRLMPVRVIGPDGSGGYSNLISGIRWAVDHGADVINLSLGGTVNSSILRDAVQYAVNNGVTIIAAAGNNSTTPILYPAKYPEVISVGAVGPAKKQAYYSNYGPDLDLVAPGGDSTDNTRVYPTNMILSTAGPDNEYSWKQGTSMAAPHVTGLVALLYSSGIKDPVQIQKLLKQTADDLGPAGFDQKYGAGLVNINKALNIKVDQTNNSNNESDTIGSNTDSNPNIETYIAQTKIFTVDNTSKKLEAVSTIIHPNSDGNFSLQTEAGTWSLIGWLDVNQNNSIDSGDYFKKVRDIRVEENQSVSSINIMLEKIK